MNAQAGLTARWRMQGRNPGDREFDGRSRYRLRDVEDWAEQQGVGDRTRRR